MRAIALLALMSIGCGRVGFATHADDADATLLDDGDIDSDVDQSLRLWLELDALPVVDSSGHAVAVSCGVSGCPTLVPGQRGSAARFANGAVLRIAALNLPALTFATWARLDSGTAASATIAAKAHGGGVLNSWELFVLANGTLRAGGDTVVVAYGSTTFSQGIWHHVALTWDGATAYGYFDGAMFIDALPLQILWDATDVTISGDIDTGAEVQPWLGELDDVRIYDRALGAAEIARLATP